MERERERERDREREYGVRQCCDKHYLLYFRGVATVKDVRITPGPATDSDIMLNLNGHLSRIAMGFLSKLTSVQGPSKIKHLKDQR